MSYLDDLNAAAQLATEASARADSASAIFHAVAHGLDSQTVTTENGEILTLANAVKRVRADIIGFNPKATLTGDEVFWAVQADGTDIKVPVSQIKLVDSVNGQTGEVTLDAASVGSIPTSARGIAEGVASLDVDGLVPLAQLPTIPDAGIEEAPSDGTVYGRQDEAWVQVTGGTGSGAVDSVNGQIGVVTLDTDDISEGTSNKYYPAIDKTKLANIAPSAQVNTVNSVNSKVGDVVINASDVGALPASEKGAVNGVASLDGDGKLTTSQLPDITSARKVTVTDSTDRLALASYTDLTIAYQSDDGSTWALNANDDPSIEGNWTQLGNVTVGGVTSFNGRTGNVTSQAGDYTAAQVNAVSLDEKGSPDGVATLDTDGKIPSSQIPSSSTGVTEAPLDGFGYVRQNGSWQIQGTGSGGGGGYIVSTKEGSLAGQVHSFPFQTPQYGFGYDTYALKQEGAITNQSLKIERFDADSAANYEQTSILMWDGNMHQYTGEDYTLVSDGSFYSSQVTVEGTGILLTGVKSNNPNVPVMTSNTAPSGYVASSQTLYSSADTEPYYAFNQSPSNAWFSGLNSPLPQWLKIELPSPVTINSYEIVNRLDRIDGTPSDWVLQGSSDDVTWFDIHTVSSRYSSVGESSLYALDKGYTYKYFRIRVSKVRNTGDIYVAIAQFNLFAVNKILIRDSSSQYYSASNGVLTAIPTPISTTDIDSTGTTSTGIIDTSLLTNLPISVVSGEGGNTSTAIYANNQIAIQDIRPVSSWQHINSTTLTVTETGSGVVRVAVSRDGFNWYTYNGSSWSAAFTLTADTVGADYLITNGMSPLALNSLSETEWSEFYSGTEDGSPDNLAFAYALSVPDPTIDEALISDLTVNVDLKGAWLKQTESQVEIRWYNDQVTFKTVSAGNYKLAFQSPSEG